MRKAICLFLFVFTCKFSSFGKIDSLTIGCVNCNVNCSIGDTLRFFGGAYNGGWVTINGSTVITSTVINQWYLGQYVIAGGETSYCIANGEGQTCGPITIVPVGLATNFQKKIEINVFPNPADGNIIISKENEDETDILITDILGHAVFEQKTKQEKTVVNLYAENNGVYFIKIKSGSGLFSKKIVIQH
jgi:hypothetical protein